METMKKHPFESPVVVLEDFYRDSRSRDEKPERDIVITTLDGMTYTSEDRVSGKTTTLTLSEFMSMYPGSVGVSRYSGASHHNVPRFIVDRLRERAKAREMAGGHVEFDPICM
jgi:hypothetical protein